MPIDDSAFHDRARAESFGAVAAQYDRYRPTYPDALVHDLLASGAREVLDIGCGTGKAAVLFAAQGVHLLGVEPDPAMAEVARSHGLDVEVGMFETWDDAGRRFDLVISAQAWHWVDPAVAAPKVAGLLRPGGTFAPFWNYDDLDERTRDVVDGVYSEHAPELVSHVGARRDTRRYAERLGDIGAFTSVGTHDYRWQKTMSGGDWVGMVCTHSDHLLLAADRRAALAAALRAAIAARLGGEITLRYGTYLIRCT